MPMALPTAIAAVAHAVADAAIAAVTSVTGPLTATAFNAVYAVAFYGTQLAIYAGVSESTTPRRPGVAP